MFSKTIFKQTLRQNWKLWAIFTGLTAVMSAVVIAVYDPKMIQSIMDMARDMPGLADMMGDRLEGATSLLGMLGESFYAMQGVILPLIFVIMTANSLVASQVDRGSMAYTLSAPIKRAKVVSTQALYMITSVLCLFLVVTLVGLGTVQLAHSGLWGTQYTADVKAVSETLNLDREDVADDPGLILENPAALEAGAQARGIEEDVYAAYLNLKLTEKAYGAAAEALGADADTVAADPLLIKSSEAALTAAAEVMGLPPAVFSAVLDQAAAQRDTSSDQMKELQSKLMAGIRAAADELGLEADELASDLGKIKDNPKALAAAVAASGTPEEMLVGVINQQLAGNEITLDHGVDFSVTDYLNLNLGVFLLMFAMAGISFLFSCVFNLTKNSLALGAGIPIACLIFQIMGNASSSLENFKYLSLNTLFAPSEITGGGTFLPQFIVLAVLGAALYLVGIKVFKEKDLPL
jgi:ABC-2 type transport system permease protein